MAAAYRAVVAERKDIVVITIGCERCGSEVSVNAEIAIVPVACPSCGREYDGNATSALVSLSRFHKAAKTAEEQAGKPLFRFHIKQND